MCSPQNAANTIKLEAEDRECHMILAITEGECLRIKPILKHSVWKRDIKSYNMLKEDSHEGMS